jgi:hypothetical protein
MEFHSRVDIDNRTKPIFEGVFTQNEEFGGVCGAWLHKHPHFLLFGGKKPKTAITLN